MHQIFHDFIRGVRSNIFEALLEFAANERRASRLLVSLSCSHIVVSLPAAVRVVWGTVSGLLRLQMVRCDGRETTGRGSAAGVTSTWSYRASTPDNGAACTVVRRRRRGDSPRCIESGHRSESTRRWTGKGTEGRNIHTQAHCQRNLVAMQNPVRLRQHRSTISDHAFTITDLAFVQHHVTRR
jgi:hypothetical protein